jgi:hypothetical protein
VSGTQIPTELAIRVRAIRGPHFWLVLRSVRIGLKDHDASRLFIYQGTKCTLNQEERLFGAGQRNAPTYATRLSPPQITGQTEHLGRTERKKRDLSKIEHYPAHPRGIVSTVLLRTVHCLQAGWSFF